MAFHKIGQADCQAGSGEAGVSDHVWTIELDCGILLAAQPYIMGLEQKHLKLLKWGFNEIEWNYLMGIESFNAAISKADDTVEAVEKLSLMGEGFIRGWEEKGRPLSSN